MKTWKEIAGFSGYQVSSDGFVMTKRGRIMKHTLNRGYPQVIIGGKCFRVHTLVATAFLPNPLNKTTVNHKNGIKTDNRVGNLEWATLQENKRHATENGLVGHGERHGKAKLTRLLVEQVRGRLLNGETCTAIAKELNVSKSTISRISINKTWCRV